MPLSWGSAAASQRHESSWGEDKSAQASQRPAEYPAVRSPTTPSPITPASGTLPSPGAARGPFPYGSSPSASRGGTFLHGCVLLVLFLFLLFPCSSAAGPASPSAADCCKSGCRNACRWVLRDRDGLRAGRFCTVRPNRLTAIPAAPSRLPKETCRLTLRPARGRTWSSTGLQQQQRPGGGCGRRRGGPLPGERINSAAFSPAVP